MNEINPEWIKNRIENFFGYGNLDSKIWFIGIEDGFNPEKGLPFISQRFEKTQGLDSPVIDVFVDMEEVDDHREWYSNGITVQPTFRRITQILLELENDHNFSNENILSYQKEKLGRRDRDHALLELMPLPNQKSGSWLYKDFGKIGKYNLKSRATYLNTVLDDRIEKLRKMIIDEEPGVIVCYSFDDRYLDKWPKLLSKNDLTNQSKQPFYRHYENNGTHLFVTPHTIASSLKKHNHPRVTNEDWTQIRNEIIRVLNNN